MTLFITLPAAIRSVLINSSVTINYDLPDPKRGRREEKEMDLACWESCLKVYSEIKFGEKSMYSELLIKIGVGFEGNEY